MQVNPQAEKLAWKPEIIERYKDITNFESFKFYSSHFPRKSIRVNTLKSSINDIKKRMQNWNLENIPWCKEGFWINYGGIGSTVEHVLGYIYVQEAASMIPASILEPEPGEFILDMAASPGSKTTQIAAMMKNQGLIIANDYKIDRLKPLVMNLQRCGVYNVVTTLMEGRFFKNYKFDRILLDAPCSATGNIRSSPWTLTVWNVDMIRRLAGTQKQLIKVAYDNLKDDGILVYSTCSIDPEENESVINHLIQERNAKLEKISFNGKRSKAIINFQDDNYDSSIDKCLRIWPQDNNTEGFFIAKIRKLS